MNGRSIELDRPSELGSPGQNLQARRFILKKTTLLPSPCPPYLHRLYIVALLLVLALSFGQFVPLHANTLIYTIEEGDTLESIARRFKVSLAALMKINRFHNAEQAERNIVRGQSILIPAPDIVLASVGDRGIEKSTGQPDDKIRLAQMPRNSHSSEKTSPVVPQAETQSSRRSSDNLDSAPKTEEDEQGYLLYQVQPDDTLSSLAVHYNSSSEQIRKVNSLETDQIRVGQTLRIPENWPEDWLPDKSNDGVAESVAPAKPSGSALVLADPLVNISADSNVPSAASPASGEAAGDSEKDIGGQSYIVKKGDTLLGISRKTGTSIGVIRSHNRLEDDFIRPGQVLRISTYEQAVRSISAKRQGSPTEVHYTVAKGDTLSSISRRFGVSLPQLRQWNQLSPEDSNLLSIGQRLRVGLARSDTNHSQDVLYTVVEGDTLWSISRRFDLSVDNLQHYNPELNGGLLLRPGQTLTVGPAAVPAPHASSPNASPESLESSGAVSETSPNIEDLPELPNAYRSKAEEAAERRADEEQEAYLQLEARRRRKADLDPPVSDTLAPEDAERPVALINYFTRNAPRVVRQPNVSYYEEFTDDPLENYQTARKLLAHFDKEVSALPKISDDLAGYSFLIDPGHGGLDPGFNSQSEDGNGNPLYIIEDEYNYDYALRLYRQLRRNGAQVGLTVISPNQLIVDSPDASRTLVSQKNEVYNSPFINQRGEHKSWPIGTPSGLHKRVEVAESFFNGTPKNKRIFVSLHNDNSPWDTDGRLVLYYNDALTNDNRGERFAEHLVPFLGKGAHMRGQNLAVLRKNPARYAVLVELRNIAHARNSWAIRNADLRQEDTEMLTNGILSFVRSLPE